MATWKIAHRKGTCDACERGFEDGERHASLLLVEAEELTRRDLCSACWAARQTADGGSQAAPESGPPILWFTRHRVEVRKTVQLDLPSLERLFVDLEGRAEQRVRELRYVICLLLMRKRRLKLERILRQADGESFLVRRPRSEQRFQVHAFDFDVERIAEVRAELQAIFDGAEGEDGVHLPPAAEPGQVEPGEAAGEELAASDS